MTQHTTPLSPRHYQEMGISYLTTPRVKRSRFDETPTCCRSLLGDAPGAGKSLQAMLAADQLVPNHSPSSHSIAVICPAHLVGPWFKDIARQFPDDAIVSIEGNNSKRQRYAQTHARWYIISVQSLRRTHYKDMMLSLFTENHVDCTIIDESHYVKNRNAKQSKNVRELTEPEFCAHVILLSATPVMREADDLYMQLRIIDPYTFSSFEKFLNTYCWFTMTAYGPMQVSLRKGASDVLHATKLHNQPYTPLSPTHDPSSGWMLGRTYGEIGLELPPLIAPDPILTTFGAKRHKMYEDIKLTWSHLLEDDTNTRFIANSAMEVMHTLRRVINSPEKQETLTTYLQDDQGPFFIVCDYKWSCRDVEAKIHETYPDNQFNTTVITGEIDASERVTIAKNSSQLPNDIVIATMGSIPEGADLSACSTVYFYEQATTPGRMHQVLSRVRRHRNAQSPASITISTDPDPVTGMFPLNLSVDANERPVLVRYFHVNKTLDQRIHEVCFARAINVASLIKVELQN